jgi:hypothetical protein
MGKFVEWTGEFDYRDLLDKKDASKFRHMSFGAELTFFNFINLRAGFAHGYYSGGVGVGTRKAGFDFGYYTDELNDRLRSKPEVRYIMQYRWGFNTGPNN